MDQFVQLLSRHAQVLGPIDHFTLGVNLCILLFSKWFASKFWQTKDERQNRQRLRILHSANLVLFATYLLAVVFEFTVARSISQSFLVIFAGYLLIHASEGMILKKYGKTRTIEEVARITETYTSRTLELVLSGIITFVSVILLINIWGFEDWLQTTSVLGFLALFVFASKEYWAADFIAGIIIISQGRITRGDVVRLESATPILGIVLQTTSLHTIIRDLVNGHDVIAPNSHLRQNVVEVLKTDLKRGIRNHVDFMIGYGAPNAKVKGFLEEVWKITVEQKLADADGGLVTALKECGDHGVRWRLAYSLKSPYTIIASENAIRETAYDLQEKHGIELATPLTHDLSKVKAALSGTGTQVDA